MRSWRLGTVGVALLLGALAVACSDAPAATPDLAPDVTSEAEAETPTASDKPDQAADSDPTSGGSEPPDSPREDDDEGIGEPPDPPAANLTWQAASSLTIHERPRFDWPVVSGEVEELAEASFGAMMARLTPPDAIGRAWPDGPAVEIAIEPQTPLVVAGPQPG